MNEQRQQSPDAVPTELAELCPIARGTARHLSSCALVLEAMGIEYLQTETVLAVRPADEDQACRQLQAFLDENRHWPQTSPALPQRQTAQPPTLLMIGGLALFFLLTGPWGENNPWFQAGAIDSNQILQRGEWWRLVTALTLHAGTAHLLGNCLIGGFMVHLLCKTIGSGSAWFFLLLAGASGNLFNIIFRETTHHSVGFSTAVFAAIGIFTGLKILSQKFSFMTILLPLGAGMGLLAFLGTEGAQTDLGAHLFGFSCGISCGFLIKATGWIKTTDHHQIQSILLTTAILLIVSCWWLAGRNSALPLL